MLQNDGDIRQEHIRALDTNDQSSDRGPEEPDNRFSPATKVDQPPSRRGASVQIQGAPRRNQTVGSTSWDLSGREALNLTQLSSVRGLRHSSHHIRNGASRDRA